MKVDTILLVDDEEDIRVAVQEVLTDQGYGVRATTNGKEALAQLQAGYRPALILLDLGMPEMDGFEFLKHVRDDPTLAKIPVILITAAGEKSRFAKAEAVIHKPIELEVLLRHVERYCPQSD